MSLNPEQLERIRQYLRTRDRSAGAPRMSDFPHPEVISGVPESAGGNFTADDLRAVREFEETGSFGEPRSPFQSLEGFMPEAPMSQGPVGQVPTPTGTMEMPDHIREMMQRRENPQAGPVTNAIRGMLSGAPETTVGSPSPQAPQEPMIGPQPVPGEAGYPETSPGGMEQPPPHIQELMEGTSTGGQSPPPHIQELMGRGPLEANPLPDPAKIEEMRTEKLHGQVRTSRAGLGYHIDEEDVPQKEEDPGFLSKVFDILMRPNYAMAAGARHAQEAFKEDEDQGFLNMGTIPAFGRGMREGFTGRDKNTFADVLEDEGVTNPIVKGTAGFILDVALDPTTYIGGSVLKAASKGAVEASATKAATALKGNKGAMAAAKGTAEERVRRELMEELGPNATRATRKAKAAEDPAKDFAKRVDKYANEEIESLAKEHTKSALKAAKYDPDNIGKFEFKFAGQTIVSSPKVYTAAGKFFRPIADLPPMQRAAMWFNPRKEIGDIHNIVRYNEAINVAAFEDSLVDFEKYMRAFSGADRKAISHAIEGTRNLEDPKLLKAKERVERIFENFFDSEVALGILKPEQKRQNYLYHFYKTDHDVARMYKKNIKKKPEFAHERAYVTLEQAKRDGMKPIEDVMAVVRERAAKHYQTLANHSIIEEAVTEYGIRGSLKSKANKPLVKALDDLGIKLEPFTGNKGEKVLLPDFIVKNFNQLAEGSRQSKEVSQMLRHLDKSQSAMKFWLTVANPGHHVRNFTGNAFQAYQDGVRNPHRYIQAVKGIRGGRKGATEAQKKLAQNTRVKMGKKSYETADELYDIYVLSGTRSGFMTREIAHNPASKAGQVIRGISQTREDTARLGHFIDVLSKTAPDNWAQMTKAQKVAFARKPLRQGGASARVKKFQVDYSDLTNVEKRIARRVMMFYTFARKNTVLQLEMMALRPGKIANVKKTTNAIEQVLGTSVDDEDTDFMERIPEWILEMNAPRIAGGNVESVLSSVFRTGADPVYANMLLPTSDLNRIQPPQEMLNRILSEVRPEIGVPIEVGVGRTTFTGAPLPDATSYAMQQTPVTNLINRATQHAQGEPSGNQNPLMDLSNWLSGLSLQRVTPARQQSELRRQQDEVGTVLRDERSQKLEEVLEQLREGRKPR